MWLAARIRTHRNLPLTKYLRRQSWLYVFDGLGIVKSRLMATRCRYQNAVEVTGRTRQGARLYRRRRRSRLYGAVNSFFKNSAAASHFPAAADQSTSIARTSGGVFTRGEAAMPGRSGICALGPAASRRSTSTDSK